MADSRVTAAPPADLAARHRLCAGEDLLYLPRFLADAATIHARMLAELDWGEESISMFGRQVRVPRLCTWCGDRGVVYRYSRTNHRADGWPDCVAELRDRLHAGLGMRFNFVLGNLYRDGRDAMGWHADDEPELGDFPCIASLSFGAPRRFDLRARNGVRRMSVALESGSLLLMWGTSQRRWQHALPRVNVPIGPRINLTFRRVEVPA